MCLQVNFWLSFGRWDSEQGKMHPMRKNIIMILADRKAQQYPLEQMEGVGRRTSILKCQALCSVSSHTSPHSSLTSAHELNAIPSHDVSTEETEAQRGSRTHSKFSMAKNPCFQFMGSPQHMVAVYYMAAAVIVESCDLVTSQQKFRGENWQEKAGLLQVFNALPSCLASTSLTGMTFATREMLIVIIRQTVN